MIRSSSEDEANPKGNVPQPVKERDAEQTLLERTVKLWNVQFVTAKNTSEPSALATKVVDAVDVAD